jgi:hypothetical protein
VQRSTGQPASAVKTLPTIATDSPHRAIAGPSFRATAAFRGVVVSDHVVLDPDLAGGVQADAAALPLCVVLDQVIPDHGHAVGRVTLDRDAAAHRVVTAPTIVGNVITGTTLCSGGAVNVRSGAPLIRRNVIRDNHASGPADDRSMRSLPRRIRFSR